MLNFFLKTTATAFLLFIPSSLYSLSADLLYFEPILTNAQSDASSQFGDVTGDGVIDFVNTINRFNGKFTAELNVFQGNQNGGFTVLKSWGWLPSPSANGLLGDWIKGGARELLTVMEMTDHIYYTYSFTDNSINRINASIIDTYKNFNQSFIGDFDSDGNNDFFFVDPDNRLNSLFYGKGDGSFVENVYPFLFQILPVSADVNGDFATDGIIPSQKGITTYYGNPSRGLVFKASSEISVPKKVTRIYPLNYQNENRCDLLLAAETDFYFLKNNGNNKFEIQTISLPGVFNKNQFFIADIDQDNHYDLISFNNYWLSIFKGDSNGNFTLAGRILLKYVNNIINLYVSDMNSDGKQDIILCPGNGPVITLLQHTEPITQPTMAPTPTPIPPKIPVPTPPPAPDLPQIIHVNPGDDLQKIVAASPSGSVIQLAAGVFGNILELPFLVLKITDKKIHLLGCDDNFNSRLPGLIICNNATVTIQNILLGPKPDFEIPLTLINSNALLIHNRVIGSRSIITTGFYGYTFPAGPTILLQNAENNAITFIDNQIERGDKATVSIESCTGCTLNMEQNSRFGLTDQPSHVQIKDSTKIKLFLPAEIDNYVDLTFLEISGSDVDIYHGLIQGIDGQPGITGQNGSPGVILSNESAATFHATRISGGRGGDGIKPGVDAEPILFDKNSFYGWVTVVQNWDLY